MARCGWISSSSPSPCLNRDDYSGNPTLQDYFLDCDRGKSECSAVDEEIMLMTDEEKEAFVRMQNELEEQHLEKFYKYYDKKAFLSVGAEENEYTEDEHLDYYDGNGFRPMDGMLDIRVENPRTVSCMYLGDHHRRVGSTNRSNRLLVYQSSQRSRDREARHEQMELEDEFTFHPHINPSNVLPRYMNYGIRRTRQLLPSSSSSSSSSLLAVASSGNATEDLIFKPVVNRLRSSSISDRLSQYLKTPVHMRLNRTAIVSPRKLDKEQLEHGRNSQQHKENKSLDAFLQRLEESNRRREKNLELLTMMCQSELTFHPELSSGTRRQSVSSAIGSHIRGERMKVSALQRSSSVCSADKKRKNTGVGKETTTTSAIDERGRHTPHINARSQSMRRSVNDLRMFEERRQKRLQQLRAEQELEVLRAARETCAGIMTLSAGSQRLAECMFGGNATHDAIQGYLERQAHLRAEALCMEYEAKQREEEMQFTFHPEVHQAPPYVQDIARQLAVNKSIAPKTPMLKPAFRFS